jgi:hypothetical protein
MPTLVQLGAGSVIELATEPNQTVESLKKQIFETHGIPPIYQQLYINDQILNDDTLITETDSSATIKLKPKDEIKNILAAATSGSYNADNNLKCRISFEKMEQGDDFNVELKIVNEGRWTIKTPLYQPTQTSHWKDGFCLFMFDEETKEFITAIIDETRTDQTPTFGEQIILKPEESVTASFESVFLRNKLNTGKVRDVIFVVCSLPNNAQFVKFQRDLLLMETDTFTVQFWKSAWKTLTEEVWSSKRFISNALLTSVEFKDNRLEFYNILLG